MGVEIPAGDDRSDTLVFAEDWLPNFLELLDDESGFGELEELVSGSKICIFSTAPELESQVYILNEDLGHWVGGLWWSNYSYSFKNTFNYWSESKWDYVKDYDYNLDNDYCFSCEMYKPHALVDFVCATCNSCLDCMADLDDCLCYRPDLHQESLFGESLFGGEY